MERVGKKGITVVCKIRQIPSDKTEKNWKTCQERRRFEPLSLRIKGRRNVASTTCVTIRPVLTKGVTTDLNEGADQ